MASQARARLGDPRRSGHRPGCAARDSAAGHNQPHYGLLPRYRGMNVTEWSIYYDDPVGVTVHAVDPGIDTGEILLQETLTVPWVRPLPRFGNSSSK